MSYDAALYSTSYASVSRHNREQFCPDNAFIITENSKDANGRGILQFFKEASLEIIKDVFQVAAEPAKEKKSQFMLVHSINDGDTVQNTNSKMASLHIHSYTADFAPDYAHITDPEIKSYVVKPNVSLGTIVDEVVDTTSDWDFDVIDLSGDEAGEATYHKVLFHPGFGNFYDFAENADDSQWEEFRQNMIDLIEPLTEPNAGGARIVYDEKIGTDWFALSVYGGENLDRSGQNKQRYFEMPFNLR